MTKRSPEDLLVRDLRVSYPEYTRAFGKFIVESSKGLVQAKDPVLSQIRTTNTERRGPSIVGGGNNETQLHLFSVETSLLLSLETIRDTDVSGFLASMEECADKALESFMPQFLDTLSDACSENTFDANGQPFSHDMFIDAIEHMEMSFDASDNPILPTLVTGTQLAERIRDLPVTEEQQQRLNQVLARKKAEHIAKKRVRKLR